MHPRYRRLLVRLLCLALAPVLVLAANSQANALTDYYGTSDKWEWYASDGISIDPPVIGEFTDAMMCDVKGYSVGNTVSLGVKGNIRCTWGWNGADPDWDDASVSGSLLFMGTRPDGNVCEFSAAWSPQPKTLNEGTTWSAFGTATSDCAFDEACFTYDVSHDNFGPINAHHTYEMCADVSLPVPPYGADKPTGTCPQGTPASIDLQHQDGEAPTWQNYVGHVVTATFTNDPPTNQATSGTYWHIDFAKYNSTGTSVTNDSPYSPNSTQSNKLVWAGPTILKTPTQASVSNLVKHLKTQPDEWIGAQISFGSGGTYGRTIPANCTFWFGPKIIDDPNTTQDNPWGTVNTTPNVEPTLDPPVAPPAGCVFKATDPSTWLTGGMCAVVGLLKGIWGTLGTMAGTLSSILATLAGLGAQIAGAIVSGLQDLLVPGDADWGFDDLYDQMKERPPFSLIWDLGDAAVSMADGYSGAGSCGTLANFGGDLTVSCAKVKSFAGFGGLYALAQVALWSMTALGCWKLVSNFFQDGQ